MNFILEITGDFKPGDDPPSGYCDWHEWAKVQTKAGLKQVRCCRCSKWKFPQELSGRVHRSNPVTSAGVAVKVVSPICKQCDSEETQ